MNGRYLIFVVIQLAAFVPRSSADERGNFFEANVRPILSETCYRCHGGVKTSNDLRVDSRDALLKGGKSGPAIVPGNAAGSRLYQSVRRVPGLPAMPPSNEHALRPDQVAAVARWINDGAAWPANARPFTPSRHWAFEPIRDTATPATQDKAWTKTSIDAFIRAKQETAGAKPAPLADRLTLIRRATFDLTGLPPTPKEIDDFVQDTSPRAFEAVVDRLLRSPAYGEKWGRHWLDLVRYADTAGETADYPVTQAWRYRNYVIDAFNADTPYDEFIREQIAGDILADQGPPNRYAQRVTATGYLAVSRRFGFDSENYQHLTIQDTIDTMGQTILGLSLGCARCHDHKFDAVTMRDYYALYGIFDSSRYAFPGSEQKQRVRAMVPLISPSESHRKWREYESTVAALAESLATRKKRVPAVILRSLHDVDGDFELQAPAAGGSNGVLVPPWSYSGKIAITNSAQSPFRNFYFSGRVGANVPSGTEAYRIEQVIHPPRSSKTQGLLFANVDFRLAPSPTTQPGVHRFSLGAFGIDSAIVAMISSDSISLKVGDQSERLATIRPGVWHNLQLMLDFNRRVVSGRIATKESTIEFGEKAMPPNSSGVIDFVRFDADDPKPPHAAIDWDNFGLHDAPIPPATTSLPALSVARDVMQPATLEKRLKEITGIDGDFELQADGRPPNTPWGPGPNSVVKVSATSQSPFRNLFPKGGLGIHMPNRSEYDGFGQKLDGIRPDAQGRLFSSFDFRCGSDKAGGNGSWRYYLGHGPGHSAAIELFFNSNQFFRRSDNSREPVCRLHVGEWYQVQLTLDTKKRTYSGVIASRAESTTFAGQVAKGWDGVIDETFIDSYGHIGGVRPALDADNFVVRGQPLPAIDASPVAALNDELTARRSEIERLRRRLAELDTNLEKDKRELERLMNHGPFAMAYGVVEGTPRNARIQLRGEPDRLSDEVPRGFIKALGGGDLPRGTVGSGRLELARWLTRPDHPLTARVMVNRIWQHHFARGLVKTPNDFGVRGLTPTHPELLDHLAVQFVRNGWSMKAMHRLIMLSATYQLSSFAEPQTSAAPFGSETNDLYTSFRRRRLGAEEIRDSILAVSGELDRTPGEEHSFPAPIGWSFTQHNPYVGVYEHNKRSVYLMTQRLKRHPFLALFDGADPNATTADRLLSTVPTQALFFLNDPFVHAKADKWADRLIANEGDERTRIVSAWRHALGRPPTQREQEEAAGFLRAYRTELARTSNANLESRALAAFLRTLMGSNEFLHVD
jgi:hypothetical protein